MTKQSARTKYIKIRVTNEESQLNQTGARNADKPVSQYLRDLSMGTPPIKAALIEQTAADVRNKARQGIYYENRSMFLALPLPGSTSLLGFLLFERNQLSHPAFICYVNIGFTLGRYR